MKKIVSSFGTLVSSERRYASCLELMLSIFLGTSAVGCQRNPSKFRVTCQKYYDMHYTWLQIFYQIYQKSDKNVQNNF